eukprot:TRINITY_DN2396_c0_g3_i1.p1 TRINITY_DN2396_c0_g3~~TRINITY_DN2396_c0_g3_i1.p1  ORF type:complete len:681 (-),score=226.88 TRINITY_DN2396_c0_g3_i1:93-2135(-)
MQFTRSFLLALCGSAVAIAESQAPESPIAKVVLFIKDLENDLKKSMDTEQKSYDKYVDWCDETISTANKEIEEAKQIIDEQTAIIEKMSGKGGASGAEIDYLKKTIIENGEHQKEARITRKRENGKYVETEEDLTSGIHAMEDMLESLGGASTAPKVSFLSTDADKHTKQVRQVIEKALKMKAITSKLSTKDLQSLRSFAQGETGLMQLKVGDAPESNLGGILNIIQQTMEDYQKDLDAVNKEENDKVTAFNTLLKNLAEELDNMKTTLAEQESLKGNSAQSLAEAKMLREETETEKKADEKVLVETQDACKVKKDQFEARKALREEELAGVTKGKEILESKMAQFGIAAQVSFLQISGGSDADARRDQAYTSIKALAAQYKDYALAQIAMRIQKNTGHFDKVIDIIDRQIKNLREEEQTDEDHRDRCQKQLAQNSALIQELTHTSNKFQTKVDRLSQERDEVKSDYDTLLKDMENTNKEIKERGEMRTEERDNHLKALQADKDALAILGEAIVSITDFYKTHGLTLSLAQGPVPKAPDAGFSDKNYVGDQQATSGLLSLMNMVKEDMENEIKDSKETDAKDQAQYEADYSALKNKLDKQDDAKVTTEKGLADLQERISAQQDNKDETDSDNSAANDEKKALEEDCNWVKTNFASRRTKRQAEIEGLVDAKALLAKGGVR